MSGYPRTMLPPPVPRLIKGIYPALPTYERHAVPLEENQDMTRLCRFRRTTVCDELPLIPLPVWIHYLRRDDRHSGKKVDEPFRVIYTPSETHPGRTFHMPAPLTRWTSSTTFSECPLGRNISSGNQTWFAKELLNLSALSA